MEQDQSAEQETLPEPEAEEGEAVISKRVTSNDVGEQTATSADEADEADE